MISISFYVSVILLWVLKLCNGLNWNGPTSTPTQEKALSHKLTTSTYRARYSKPKVFRRAVPEGCGYESGSQDSIWCNTGSTCVLNTFGTSAIELAVGCCVTSNTDCVVATSCIDYSAVTASTGNELICDSNIPYCQSFTFPDLNAVAYECGGNSDSAWRTVYLTSLSVSLSTSSSTASKIFTSSAATTTIIISPPPSTAAPSPTVSQATSTPPETSSATSPPASGAAGIQDLTTPQKVGIGVGCGCGFCLVTALFFLRRRYRAKESWIEAQRVVLDEKSPTDVAFEIRSTPVNVGMEERAVEDHVGDNLENRSG